MSESRRIALEDTINAVSIEVEKAQAILSDMCEDYFDRHNPNTREGSMAILYEYKHYAILNSVVLDILKEIEDAVKKVEQEAV